MLSHELDSRSLVQRGLQGKNQGLSNGMTLLNRYLDGIQRRTYYVVAADSGVGKSTLADYMFLYNLHKSAKEKNVKLELDYYSFELPYEDKKFRMMSLFYYLAYQTTLPTAYIAGKKESKLSKEEQKLLEPIYQQVDELFEDVNFMYGGASPTEMWKNLVDRAARNGEFIRDVDDAGRQQQIVGYKPNPGTEDTMRFSIIDHIGLIDQEGRNLKDSIDQASRYFVKARNLFGDSFCVIQQFNTEMQGAARDRKSDMAYVPSRQDFGDSKYTFRDADVVLGLTRPSAFQLDSFMDFRNLGMWGDYFIVNFLLKNRGPVGKPIPMFMNSVAGIPEELDASSWSPLLEQLYIKRASDLDAITKKYNADHTS